MPSVQDSKLLENIAQFGCQVMHIAAEDDLPPFAYSVGIQHSTGAPECVVIGLKQPMAHFVVNEYNRRIRNGERLEFGQQYSGFLGNFDMQISAVDKSHYDEYFGQAQGFYQGDNFSVVQIVYPKTSGTWPWDAEANAWFRQWQPILAVPLI